MITRTFASLLPVTCVTALYYIGPFFFTLSDNYHRQIIEREVLYLSKLSVLSSLSLGYKNLLSDMLWLSTINYFGKHYRTDQDYRWLAHRCNLVTELNPKAYSAYTFCALMLAWENGDASSAYKLLSQAIENYPARWEPYYYRGFIALFFFKNERSAQHDFLKASSLPGVHKSVVALAARKVLDLENKDNAREILMQMLQNTESGIARDVIRNKLKEYEYIR
jgi:hypothetical protein